MSKELVKKSEVQIKEYLTTLQQDGAVMRRGLQLAKASPIEVEKCYQLSQLKRIDLRGTLVALSQAVTMAYKSSGNDDVTQIEMTIEFLLDDNYLKPDIVFAAVAKGIRGDFGKLYGKMNHNQFMEWIRQYRELLSAEKESKYSQPQRTRPKGEIELEPRTFDVKEFTKEQIKRIEIIESRKHGND